MSEIESLINLDTIRANLKANNIETSLNDDELNSLIDSEINKIIMITGRDIKPVPHEDIDLNFNPRTRQYNLEYYPVSSITSIKRFPGFCESKLYISPIHQPSQAKLNTCSTILSLIVKLLKSPELTK